MFDKNALNDKWIEAAEAYRKYEDWAEKGERALKNLPCEHEGRRLKKDGTPDKRYPCRPCQKDGEESGWHCNVISVEWSKVWDLFEAVGMSVKGKVTADV